MNNKTMRSWFVVASLIWALLAIGTLLALAAATAAAYSNSGDRGAQVQPLLVASVATAAAFSVVQVALLCAAALGLPHVSPTPSTT